MWNQQAEKKWSNWKCFLKHQRINSNESRNIVPAVVGLDNSVSLQPYYSSIVSFHPNDLEKSLNLSFRASPSDVSFEAKLQ